MSGTLQASVVKDSASATNNLALDASGNVTAGANLTVAGTLTGSTGILNIGSGQIYKDASGNVGIGTTSPNGKMSVTGTSIAIYATVCTAVSYTTIFNALNNLGNYYLTAYQANGTTVGSITSNGTATAYNTSSDYRLKENVLPMTTGLATVSALKPVTYKWNVDGSNGEGFIAHELQEVIPHAVTGIKDAVDDDGKPVYQGVDYSKIVVHLVAAIQELSAKNDALEARIAALESK